MLLAQIASQSEWTLHDYGGFASIDFLFLVFGFRGEVCALYCEQCFDERLDHPFYALTNHLHPSFCVDELLFLQKNAVRRHSFFEQSS